MKPRIGIGIDAHRFIYGRPLMLGGVQIEWHEGLEGHSDADVLIHAIADALLGAAGLEDIGHYFPDTDPAYKDMAGKDLLRKVAHLVEGEGCKIGNIDAVLILEQPRIEPHRHAMRQNLAEILGLREEEVTVRATTFEKMGFTGRGEGVSAHAVALLECEAVAQLDL